MNLNEEGFRFAFTIESFLKKEVRDDSAFVKYIVRAFGKKDGEKYEKLLPYHKCKDRDFESFAPFSKADKSSFEIINNDPKRGFYCIDWDDDKPFEIYGQTSGLNYQRLEAILVPCNYVHKEFGEVGDYVREECKSDLDSQINYLGNLNVIIAHTTQVFQLDGFGDESVINETQLKYQQVNEQIPNWIGT